MASDELNAIIELLRAQPVIDADFAARRASMEANTGIWPLPEGTTIEPVDAGGVPCEWVAARGVATDRAILYVHGGAYTTGSLATHRRHVAQLSAAAGARVLNVDYRLAPEHPHPAAVDDALAAYRWLTGEAGIRPDRVVLSGDSAGGGLAVAMLVALRDGGDPLPAGAALISPWTDLTFSGASHDSRLELDPMCSRSSLTPSADAYVGSADPKAPLISPAYADLAGLPPLLIHVGDHETLLDDSTLVAERAAAAGVDVELVVVPEMIHVWHVFAGMVPESDVALAELGRWIQATLSAS
jgi:monoterpene epsilon-lactone hydrolase